jgi:hypothetical protein
MIDSCNDKASNLWTCIITFCNFRFYPCRVGPWGRTQPGMAWSTFTWYWSSSYRCQQWPATLVVPVPSRVISKHFPSRGLQTSPANCFLSPKGTPTLPYWAYFHTQSPHHLQSSTIGTSFVSIWVDTTWASASTIPWKSQLHSTRPLNSP